MIVVAILVLGACTPEINCLPAPSDQFYLAYQDDSFQFSPAQYYESPSVGLVRDFDTIYLANQLVLHQGEELSAVLVKVDWLNNSQDYKLLLHDNKVDTLRLFWQLEIQDCADALRRSLDSISYNGVIMETEEELFVIQ